jgi:A/G-specific adenine glycosylase
MLQQTQVNTVIPYYHRFLDLFPDVAALARAVLQDVLKCWEGLGYYARARNLHRAAAIVVNRFNGRVPDDWKHFRSLPGVGPYIGAAVLSIAHDRVLAVVDGNVKRVLARIFEDSTPVNGSTAHKLFSRLADILIDPTSPGRYNQALMEVGALVCRPANPRCDQCPVIAFCRAYRHGSVDDYPRRNQRKPVPEMRIAVGVIRRNGRVLITQRRPDGLLGGLWEFPGGKMKPGETAEAACRREITEEVGLDIRVDSHLTQVRHAYTHFKIVMDVFLCDYIKGTVQLHGPVDHCWIDMADIDRYPIPKANLKFISKLKNPEILNG